MASVALMGATVRSSVQPKDEVSALPYLFLPRADASAGSGAVVFHDLRPEVEELFQRQQVLVSLLSPLAEPDQDEILLEVAPFLGQCMQPCTLDRDRSLQREALGALDLLLHEYVQMVPLGEHNRADRLAVRNQWQRHQRAAAPEVFVVRRGGPEPALVIFLIKRDLTQGGVNKPHEVLGDLVDSS